MSLKHETGNHALDSFRQLARYQTHGGYVWAAVMSDGALVCNQCARTEYRQIYLATRDKAISDWQCVGLTNSGEMESSEYCAHCNATIGSDHV